MMPKKLLPARHQTVNVPAVYQEQIEHERIQNCPETGINLDSVNIPKHCKNLWGSLDEREPAYAEARRRRDHLMHEHAARETERGISHTAD